MMASVVKTGVRLNRKAKFNNKLCCRHYKFGETIEWPIVESSLTLCLRRSLKRLHEFNIFAKEKHNPITDASERLK